MEDEVVLRDLGQRGFQSTTRCGRKNNILEASSRDDGFNRSTAGRTKKAGKGERRHAPNPTLLPG